MKQRITLKDLYNKVDQLNKDFKKTDRTYIRFKLSQAYGGTKLVLVSNKGGSITDITYGYNSKRETMERINKLNYAELKRRVINFHKYIARYK